MPAPLPDAEQQHRQQSDGKKQSQKQPRTQTQKQVHKEASLKFNPQHIRHVEMLKDTQGMLKGTRSTIMGESRGAAEYWKLTNCKTVLKVTVGEAYKICPGRDESIPAAATNPPLAAPMATSTAALMTTGSSGAKALFASYANIRRFHGTLMEEQFVLKALTAAGYAVELAVHKQGTKQSHGRWEVRGVGFELHPGYRENMAPPAPLVDTIIQGTKGWKKDVLDDVAQILEKAHLEQRSAHSGASGSFAPPLSPEARQKLKVELRKINISKDSYVEPELRDCDAQGFMAAGVVLWIWDYSDGWVNILMALEQRKPGQRPLLNFIGGKRDALGESARETAAREATEETGGLLSAPTRAAILNAHGPVLWDSEGKYVVFVVEAAAEDANLPRRLQERGGASDPSLIDVGWLPVSDLLSEARCKVTVAEHHHHLLRLLRPHLRTLQMRVALERAALERALQEHGRPVQPAEGPLRQAPNDEHDSPWESPTSSDREYAEECYAELHPYDDGSD